MARNGVIRAVSTLLRCPERYVPERGGANPARLLLADGIGAAAAKHNTAAKCPE